ncbi:MAG TPA: hypothetical protein VHW23_02950 [Kofleriaceae bacterium]|jgi:hypothetical protein|nr:hypothetical protein [Kofleriaceae bacterium]
MSFGHWQRHFEHNQRRPLPEVTPPADLAPAQRRALAWSLARFQIGEVGEGRIARDIWRVCLPGIDDAYRVALGLFVKEEGRHARIAAEMVRALGGRLLTRSWSHGLFRFVRRQIGARTKLLMFFAAEVIAVGCYGLLAEALPASPLRAAMAQICDDERGHMAFHGEFFGAVAPRGIRRAIFLAAWSLVGTGAALLALAEHRRTLRAFGIPLLGAARGLVRLVVDGGRRASRAPHLAAAGAAP